jgi:hypothetical protein
LFGVGLSVTHNFGAKKRKSFFYSIKGQMEDNTRPVARVIVCLSQENIAKLIYLLDSVLVARKNLGA